MGHHHRQGGGRYDPGRFGAVGTNGERTCALITGYDYASLTNVTLYGGGVGTQIAGGSYVTITVEWAYTTSALTLSAASVEAGGTVTASIGAYDVTFSHQVMLEFGTKTQTWDVAAGVTAQAVTVPVGWLDQIPTAQSGPCAGDADYLFRGRVCGRGGSFLDSDGSS